MKNLQTWFLLCSITFVGYASTDKILSRHARAMMIDMRGTPDTNGECRGAGFQRNATDCTQFFRCVDFQFNQVYTIFRFMCGPMAVFDESRSLCTGPELAQPPCPADQLAVFTANLMLMMKPTGPATQLTTPPRPQPPIVSATQSPPTQPPQTQPPPPPPTQPPTAPPTQPPPPPPTQPPTAPPTQPPTAPPTQPPTAPPTEPPTAPPTQPPTLPPTQPPTQPPTAPPTQPPTLPPTQPPTAPPTQPPTVPPTQPPTAPPTQSPTAPPTQPPTAPPTQPPTVPPTQPPTVPPTQPPTAPPTQPPTAPPTQPPTAPPTQPPPVPPTQPPTVPPTQPPTAPPTEPPTAPPTQPPTLPPTQPPTQPPTAPPTQPPVGPPVLPVGPPVLPVGPPNPPVGPPSPPVVGPPSPPSETNPLNGIIPVGCDNQSPETFVAIPANTLFGVMPTGSGGQVSIDGADSQGAPVQFEVAPGNFIGITTTGDGGFVNGVTNGVCASTSTTITLPAGSTIQIYQIVNGVIVVIQQITITVTQVFVRIPFSSIVGTIQLGSQQQFTGIGSAFFTTTSFTTTTSTFATFGIVQVTDGPVSTLTVTTESPILPNTAGSLVGIIPMGASIGPVSETTDFEVPSDSTLGVIPPQGSGSVVVLDQGSSTSTTFNVMPGSIFVAVASAGPGQVNYIAQNFFTTSLTTITFPAGTVFGILNLNIGGIIVGIENQLVTTGVTTITVPIQSVAGIVQTSPGGWQVTGIGSATFQTRPIFNTFVGSSELSICSFIGVLNLGIHSSSTATGTATTVSATPGTLTGFLTIGPEQVLSTESSVATTSMTIPKDDILGMIMPGGGYQTLTFVEEGASQATMLTLPAGTIFGIRGGDGEGSVTGIVNGIFTSDSTTITFPAGSTLIVYIVGTGGRIVYEQVLLISKTVIRFTVPNRTIVGIMVTAPSGIISISSITFGTQFVATSPENESPALLGVLQVATESTSSPPVITSTTYFAGRDPEFVVGLFPVGAPMSATTGQLTTTNVPGGSTLGVIPAGGVGQITIVEDAPGSPSTNIDIPAGHMIGILASTPGGSVTGIAQNWFTTATSVFQFPAGTSVNLIKVGADGRLVVVSVVVTQSAMTIMVPVQSTVGLITTSSSGQLTNIGSATFTTGSLSFPTDSPSSVSFGILNLATSVPTTSTIEILSSETLSGIVHIGSASVVSPPAFASMSAVTIPVGSMIVVFAAEGQGEMIVSEQVESLINMNTFAITAGSMLSIVASTTEGTVSDVVSGFLTTNGTVFKFPAGGVFGIATVANNGTLNVVSSVTTTGLTTITVPESSTFGVVTTSEQGRITNIGPASFTIQFLSIDYKPSTDVSVSGFLGSFGVLHFSKDFQASQAVVVSSPSITGNGQTISGIVQLGIGSLTGTEYDGLGWAVADQTVPANSAVAILPLKGHGVVTIASTSTVCSGEGAEQQCSAVLNVIDERFVGPGRMFVISAPSEVQIGGLSAGFFSTASTTMTFAAGTVYGVASISADGRMSDLESSSTVAFDISVSVPLGSTIGLIGRDDSNPPIITSIGGAYFFIKAVTSNQVAASQSSLLVGILDIASALGPLTPTVPATQIALPPFTIDCSAGIHRYPYDCNRFYQCFGDGDEQQVYVFSCAPGLIFDEVLTRCTKPAESTCEATTSDSTELFGGSFQLSCGTDALHRYPLDCNNFYQCFKNGEEKTIYIFACAPGLVFDEPSSQCVLPSETDSCVVSENYIKNAPFFFEFGQRIDLSLYLPSYQQQVISFHSEGHDSTGGVAVSSSTQLQSNGDSESIAVTSVTSTSHHNSDHSEDSGSTAGIAVTSFTVTHHEVPHHQEDSSTQVKLDVADAAVVPIPSIESASHHVAPHHTETPSVHTEGHEVIPTVHHETQKHHEGSSHISPENDGVALTLVATSHHGDDASAHSAVENPASETAAHYDSSSAHAAGHSGAAGVAVTSVSSISNGNAAVVVSVGHSAGHGAGDEAAVTSVTSTSHDGASHHSEGYAHGTTSHTHVSGDVAHSSSQAVVDAVESMVAVLIPQKTGTTKSARVIQTPTPLNPPAPAFYQYRTAGTGGYGTRIAPRSRNFFGVHHEEKA